MEMNASDKDSWLPQDKTTESRGMAESLVLAAKNGDQERVVEILKTGDVDIDRKYKRETALMAASRTNNTNLCKILLKHGADCNISRIRMHETPLWIAACHGNLQVMKLMLETKNCSQVNLDNTLHRCVEMNFLCGCEVLLHAGADVHATDYEGLTALHLAAGDKETSEDKVDLWKTHDQTSWLMYFSTAYEVAELLIKCGADVNANDSEKCAPLHYACESGNQNMIRLLIENKANINAVSGDSSKTPLHVLISNGHSHLVDLLLKNPNIKPNIPDGDNDTPLMTAIKLHKKECVRIFLTHEKWTDFMSIVSRGKFGMDEYIDTPMRQLIRQMPDLACYIMNKCIELNSYKDPKNPEFMARFNFFLLDDTYTSVTWENNNRGKVEHSETKKKTVDGYQNLAETEFSGSTLPRRTIGGGLDTLSGAEESTLEKRKSKSLRRSRTNTSAAPSCDSTIFNCSPVNGRCTLRNTLKPYTDCRSVVKKNHPIYFARHGKCKAVMSHPLAIALINHKWQKLSRYRFYGGLFMYVIFVVLLTAYVMLTENILRSERNSTGENGTNHTETEAIEYKKNVLNAILNLLFIFCFLNLFSQGIAVLVHFSLSLRVLEHWLAIAVYCMALVLVIDKCVHAQLSQKHPLTSSCVFLAWFNILLELRQFPVGIYFIMFMRIAYKSFVVLLIFIPIIVGFALTFTILLDYKPLFDDEFTPATVIVMLSGEVEFKDTLTADGKMNPHIKHRKTTIIVYVFFILLMVICLHNLLVGLAVSDVETLRRKSESEMMFLKADHVLTSEYYLSFNRSQRGACGCVRYKPNKKLEMEATGSKGKRIMSTVSNWLKVFDFKDSRLGAENLIKTCRQEQKDQSITLLRKEIADLKTQMGASNTKTQRKSIVKQRTSANIS